MAPINHLQMICIMIPFRENIKHSLKRFPEIYPVRPKDRLYLEIEKPMELASLSGWIATNLEEEIEIHAHFSTSMSADFVKHRDYTVVNFFARASPSYLSLLTFTLCSPYLKNRNSGYIFGI